MEFVKKKKKRKKKELLMGKLELTSEAEHDGETNGGSQKFMSLNCQQKETIDSKERTKLHYLCSSY